MSVTYSIYCENGETLWIGQGQKPYIYGDENEIKLQHEFLLRNIGKKMIVECSDVFDEVYGSSIEKLFCDKKVISTEKS
jgi:hypothetical protein